METYKETDFRKIGIEFNFVQDNHSRSRRAVLRGLHYQINPKAQGKLVRVARGAVFDVAVDIRVGSPWYGKWVSATLSEKNKHVLWVPPGFAHGFCVLEDDTDLLYKTTDIYDPETERGIIWKDPELAISWPIQNPVISDRDSRLGLFRDAETNFLYERPK